jgi:RPA family protein
MLVAVRPESFTPIEEATRDRWVRDAAMWTDRRAKRFIRTVEETPRDEWPDGVAVAADYYLGAGGSDVAEFVQPFRSAASTAMRRVCTDD